MNTSRLDLINRIDLTIYSTHSIVGLRVRQGLRLFYSFGGCMPFPVTHLRVADDVSRFLLLDDERAAAVLLGSLAPDGVHYRAGLAGAAMNEIGAIKKMSHLCPVSDERWGQVTDNEGWLAEVKRLMPTLYRDKNDDLAMGYVIHVLTDLYCNLTIWKDYRANYPEEAAKGYASTYYREIPLLDLELYQQKEMGRILQLLPLAAARDFPGRVSAAEIDAIRGSIFAEKNAHYSVYVGQPTADTSGNRIVTSAMMGEFVRGAVGFVLAEV
jgi:hypothetical protein